MFYPTLALIFKPSIRSPVRTHSLPLHITMINPTRYSIYKVTTNLVVTPPFYSTYVHLPDKGYSLPTEISDNAKFSSFFDDAMGAIDGTHINCAPSIEEQQTSHNWKGGLHRTSSHTVHLTSSFSISLVEQMVPPQMQHFSLTHAPPIYLYHRASITLPM
jgi:hypothetical protein